MKRENIVVSEDKVNEQLAFANEINKRLKYAVKNADQIFYAHIITYGCQQNEQDSEKLRGILEKIGYEFTDNKEISDLIILNTCCVRENAEMKLFGHLGELKRLKTKNPNIHICVCGCMMQQEEVAEQIRTKYSYVDLVFGTHNLYKFPEMLLKTFDSKKILVEIENSEGFIVENVPVSRTEKYKAGVSIMYGCNNFCTYCIVPFVRGRERSRLPKDIFSEVKNLADDGCSEILLLGQNVNSYGKDLDISCDFSDLLTSIDEIEGIRRIRFMTSHPKDVSDKLIEVMKSGKNICPQLHLPFQAGSNNVLKNMNRYYTKEQYLTLIEKVKTAIPNICLTTDVIVGFPGETEDDFEQTLEVMKAVRFDMAFTFIYSPRKGTPAYTMDEQVPEDIKNKRFKRLVDLQNDITRNINDKYLGAVIEVLVEGLSKKNKNRYMGRADTGKVVNFESDSYLEAGVYVKVKIDECFSWFLNGKMI